MILSIFLVADLNGSYDTKVCRKNLKQILPGVKINFKRYEFLVIVMYYMRNVLCQQDTCPQK